MPERVPVYDKLLDAEQNPVLMFQIDIQEGMRREPTRFTFDKADYEKGSSRFQKDQAAAERKEEREEKSGARDQIDAATSLDTERRDVAQEDTKLERRRLADKIEQLTGKRPTNFVGVDELRTTLSQIEGKPLALENKAP